jgi:hypothetical protein
MESANDKILDILDRLGMSGVKASEIMKMSENTFRKKKMKTVGTHQFTDKNYNDLVNYLINEFKIITAKFNTVVNPQDVYNMVIDKISHVCQNKIQLATQDDWNLFDELKALVDSLESQPTFDNKDSYNSVIEFIEKATHNDFDFYELYNHYVHSDKKNTHARWFSLLVYRRIKTIDDIINS